MTEQDSGYIGKTSLESFVQRRASQLEWVKRTRIAEQLRMQSNGESGSPLVNEPSDDLA